MEENNSTINFDVQGMLDGYKSRGEFELKEYAFLKSENYAIKYIKRRHYESGKMIEELVVEEYRSWCGVSVPKRLIHKSYGEMGTGKLLGAPVIVTNIENEELSRAEAGKYIIDLSVLPEYQRVGTRYYDYSSLAVTNNTVAFTIGPDARKLAGYVPFDNADKYNKVLLFIAASVLVMAWTIFKQRAQNTKNK